MTNKHDDERFEQLGKESNDNERRATVMLTIVVVVAFVAFLAWIYLT